MKNKSIGVAVVMVAITLFSFAQQPKTTAKSATSIDKSAPQKAQPANSKTSTSVLKPKQVLISYYDSESGLYGFKDSISDKVVVNAKYTYVNPFSCGLAAVNIGGERVDDEYGYYDSYYIGGKWGFTNTKGIVVVPLKYDDVNDFSDGMAAVNIGGTVEYDEYDESYFIGGKWGFINSAGLVVVPVKYDEVQRFSGGFGNVILSGKAGCVSKAGQTVIPIKYSGISTVNKGTAFVWNTDSTYTSKFGLVNTKGIAITPLAFDGLEYAEDGIYKAKKAELWGLINCAGKTIVPFKYSEIDNSCGYFIVTVDGLKGLLDKTGKEIYPPVNKNINPFDEDGFMLIRKDETHFSDFHKSGIKFDRKYTFEGNVARVVLNGKYGLINKKAQFIIPYKYDDIGYFSDTLAIAKLNGKQGYITMSGREFIPCIYDNIGYFNKNCAWVKLGTKQGYISTLGKEIIPIKYDEILEPYTGLEIQRVKINEKYGIINKNLGENNELIPPKFDFILDYGGDVLKSNIGGVKNSEGYVNGGKWGLVDKQSGREIIMPKYDYIWEYADGRTLVIVGGIFDPVRKSFVGGKYGFINSTGAEVIPIQFDVANPFQNGVASVTLNGVSYKINVNGEKVY